MKHYCILIYKILIPHKTVTSQNGRVKGIRPQKIFDPEPNPNAKPNPKPYAN